MTKTRPETRTESDSFGPLEVPADRYWGAQTQRSLMNFPIGWEKQPVAIVRALGVIKQACAQANKESGKLDPRLADAMIQAASEVVAGELDDHFPLVVANRVRHPVEHERQRGDLEPRHRDPWR